MCVIATIKDDLLKISLVLRTNTNSKAEYLLLVNSFKPFDDDFEVSCMTVMKDGHSMGYYEEYNEIINALQS